MPDSDRSRVHPLAPDASTAALDPESNAKRSVVPTITARPADHSKTMPSEGAPKAPAPITIPAPPILAPTREGQIIDGKYELLELVAKGGMGKIYRARHCDLRTTLPVKIMHDHIALNPE